MSEVWLPGEEYRNATRIMEILMRPLDYLKQELAGLGGLQFLYAVFSLATVVYTYQHFKSVLPAGLVALLLGLLGIIVPEVALLGYTLTILGITAVIYRLFKAVAG